MELAAFQTVSLALILGVGSYILTRWLKIPAILFYLIAGVAAGPLGLSVIDPSDLGTGLITLVELGVAIILFEGGLSLSARSFQAESTPIRRILAITIPLTGVGAAVLAHYFVDLPWRFAGFFGALIVVTGPTVIGSLLKSVYLTQRLETLLNWESLWGDVIGVLMSALALELIDLTAVRALDSWSHIGAMFALRILVGVLIGIASGFVLAKFLLPWVVSLKDPVLPGLIVVSGALATFFGANLTTESAGPLAAAISGFFLSHLQGEALHEVRHFKEQLSSLFISTLFVLLSAYINPLPFVQFWPRMIWIALILSVGIRPMAVLLALAGTPVPWRERLYVGLIGPRGIIAVATAAYAAFIVNDHLHQMELLLNLIFVTIFFSGTLATLLCRPLARLLGVMIPESGAGILIVGVNPLSSALAHFASQFVPVSFMDTNTYTCSLADTLGHRAVCADWLSSGVYEEAREEGFARLMAVTRNDALNELIVRSASAHLDPKNVYQVLARDTEELITLYPSLQANIAFSERFFFSDAIKKLERGEAALEVLSPEEVAEENGVPLLQAVNQGRGIRILQPGMALEKEGETLCFIPGVNARFDRSPSGQDAAPVTSNSA